MPSPQPSGKVERHWGEMAPQNQRQVQQIRELPPPRKAATETSLTGRERQSPAVPTSLAPSMWVPLVWQSW